MGNPDLRTFDRFKGVTTAKYYIPGSISDPKIEAVYLDDLRGHYKRLHKTGLTPLGYGETFWKNAGIYHPEKVFKTKDW